MSKLTEAMLKPLAWIGTIIFLISCIIFGLYYGIIGLVMAFKCSWELTTIGIIVISYLISVLYVYDNDKVEWPWEDF